jgi:CHAT domain-containing protein
LDWLWHAVARPVLDSLDLSPAGGETPDARLWWCPTGALTLLPVHAAQVRGGHGNGECVRAWVVSSYTTTLAALLRARPARESAHVRQLVVALPRTPDVPGLAPLPATIREAAVVARHTRKLGSVLSLVGPSATRQLVQDALATHSWLHLACHVATDATDPARTGLALADGTLTIADLAALDLPGTELAVLSACGTAAGATRLLDEAVHVAAAMQLIGYRHVIATLWSIPDLTGQRIADDLYRNLTAIGTFDTDGTARALHRALTTLRRRYPTSPQVWAPFVHFGP